MRHLEELIGDCSWGIRESYRRGVEARELLDYPAKRDARIAYLEQYLAGPTVIPTPDLIHARTELRCLKRARDAEQTADLYIQVWADG